MYAAAATKMVYKCHTSTCWTCFFEKKSKKSKNLVKNHVKKKKKKI